MTPAREPEPEYLLENFHGLVVVGRWLLVAAETLESVFQVPHGDTATRIVLLLLFAYNGGSLLLVHRTPIRQVPVLRLLGLDLLFVTLAAFHTGYTDSPFLGQCYLIIFAGAVFRGLRGGLTVAAISAALTAVLVTADPSPNWLDVRDLVPYFLISGGFSGYLMSQMRTWFLRYRQAEAEARKAEVSQQIRNREMELARTIQRAALPQAVPHIPGLEIAVRVELASEVGGDFALFLPAGDHIGVVIGDVSGKGVPAALVSTSIGHLLPSLRPLSNPGRALEYLNRDLTDRVPVDSFASLLLAEVDPVTAQLCLWTAGHPPALIWRARAQRVDEARVHNAVLGIVRALTIRPEEYGFDPEDVLLLYTDGLTERRGENGQLFDIRGAAAALTASAHLSADQIADAIMAAAAAWGPADDDVTLLVCKRAGDSDRD